MNQTPSHTPDPNELEQLTALAIGELDDSSAAGLRARLKTDRVLEMAYKEIERAVLFLKAESQTEPSADAVGRAKRILAESRPGVIERLGEGIRRVIASLELDTRLTPAVAGIRGAAATAQLAFSTDEADIDFELVAVGKERWRVNGQIDAEESGGWCVRVVDRASEQTVAEIQTETGAFEMTLPAGSYLFKMRRDELVIEVGPVLVP